MLAQLFIKGDAASIRRKPSALKFGKHNIFRVPFPGPDSRIKYPAKNALSEVLQLTLSPETSIFIGYSRSSAERATKRSFSASINSRTR
jgi:hypothetical protein